MSLLSAMQKAANAVRKIASKPSVDVFTTSVTVRKRTWISGRVGKDDDSVDSNLVLDPRPRVRELTQREIAGSAGRYQAGAVRVDHITPAHPNNPGVGYTPEQLAPEVTENGIEIIYVLEGGVTGEYKRVDLQTDGEIQYVLTLNRKRSTP